MELINDATASSFFPIKNYTFQTLALQFASMGFAFPKPLSIQKRSGLKIAWAN